MKRKPTKKEWMGAVDPSKALEIAKRTNRYIFDAKLYQGGGTLLPSKSLQFVTEFVKRSTK